MYHRTGVVCLAFCLLFACSENSSVESARFGLDEPLLLDPRPGFRLLAFDDAADRLAERRGAQLAFD